MSWVWNNLTKTIEVEIESFLIPPTVDVTGVSFFHDFAALAMK